MSPNGGGGGEGDCGFSANDYSCAHGAQINFGDLTPYSTYDHKRGGRMPLVRRQVTLIHWQSFETHIIGTQTRPQVRPSCLARILEQSMGARN